jgi:hypothetical protein
MVRVVTLTAARGVRFALKHTPAVLAIVTEQPVLYRERDVLVNRAGVCLFLTHPKFGEKVENDTGLHFQFPRQLVYPDFLHRGDC